MFDSAYFYAESGPCRFTPVISFLKVTQSAPMLELRGPPWINLSTPIVAYDVNTKTPLLNQAENMTTIISKLDQRSNSREILKMVSISSWYE